MKKVPSSPHEIKLNSDAGLTSGTVVEEGQTGMSTPPSHTLPRRLDKPLCGGGAD